MAIRCKLHNFLAFYSTTRDWQEVSSQSYAAVLPVRWYLERLTEIDIMALPKLQTVISRETFHQTATVIFFHGEHGTAEGMKAILKHILQKEFNFRHIRVIYPQAPCIPYKMNEGKPSRVWFNRSSYSPTSSENRTSIDHTCSLVRQLVNEQKSRGVGLNRVVLGGFGMGGILAMHVAFR